LDRREREAAVEWLSALACIGLKKDTIDVKFKDYYAEGWEEASGEKPLPRYPKIAYSRRGQAWACIPVRRGGADDHPAAQQQ
jgi:hypothetical protein